jgi:hypothetical protein
MTHAQIHTFHLYEQEKFDMSKSDKLHPFIVRVKVSSLVKIIKLKKTF